jgi:hypothetical protein
MAKDFVELDRLEAAAGLAPEANRKDALVNKFVNAWENQTARRAAKGGAGMTMALTLAACGGGSGGTTASTTTPTPEPETTVYTLTQLLETDDLVEEYELAFEDVALEGLTVAQVDNVSGEVNAAINVDAWNEAAGVEFSVTFGVADTAANILAYIVDGNDLDGAAEISVTDEALTLDVADFTTLSGLGATFAGAVSVEDSAEAFLASTADFGDATLVLTDVELTVNVAQAETLIGLEVELAEGATATVADTAAALLASTVDFGDAAVSVTDETLTVDVATYEALLGLGATFAGAVTIADTAEALLASEADFGDAAVSVTDETLTVAVATYEALLGLGATFAGAVTIADTAEALLASEADFGDAAVSVTDEIAPDLTVAELGSLNNLNATFVIAPNVVYTLVISEIEGAFEAEAITVAGVNDVDLTVTSPSPGADPIALDITAAGAGTLTFKFTQDANDTVTLSATSSITGFSTLAVVAGTLDVTSATIGAEVTQITVASGVVLTAAQFLALEGGVDGRSDDSDVTIIVSSQAEVDAVLAALDKLGGTLDANSVAFAASDAAEDGLDLDQANTDLDSALIQAGLNDVLPAALKTLADAEAAVTAQEEVIADFLETSFANEFVQALADGDDSGELDGDEAVTEANIEDANEDAADVFVAEVAAETGAAFVALTDDQQSAQISLARVDLQTVIDDRETALTEASDALEAGVANLVAIADAEAEDLTAALNAKDDADEATVNAIAVADVNVESTGGAADSLDDSAFGFVDDGDLKGDYDNFVINFVGTEAGNDSLPVVLATVVDGVVTLDGEIVTADDVAGTYSFSVTVVVVDDPVLYTVTIDQVYLDALVAAAQAEYDAAAAVTVAEDNLAAAINDVLNAQDPAADPDYAFEYGALPEGVVTITENTVSIDYSDAVVDLDDADGPAVLKAIDDYAAAVTALSEAETALSDFNDAVADWEATEALVDQLAALNKTLTALNDAVDEAGAAITNATDAETDPGLGLTILEANDAAVVAFDPEAGEPVDELYIFSSDDAVDGLITVTDFAADGTDRLVFGEGYTFVEMGEDETTADALGDVSVLEIFAQETETGVTLYVEGIASAGTGSGTQDLTTVEIDGVTLADLSFEDASGILSATAALV